MRITPNEIHLSDPRNYNSIYYVGTKYSKSPEFYDPFGLPLSAFGANSNELHRVRRAALNPHFSRKSVLELEAVVQSKVHKFCDAVADAIQDGRQADIHHGLRAVSVEVVTDYAVAQRVLAVEYDGSAFLFGFPEQGLIDPIRGIELQQVGASVRDRAVLLCGSNLRSISRSL